MHQKLNFVNNSLRESKYLQNYKLNKLKEEIPNDFDLYNKNLIKIGILKNKLDNLLSNSLIYIPIKYDSIKISCDFDEKYFLPFNISKESKQFINGSYYVDMQLNWCSQYSSGYLAIGTKLPTFLIDKSVNWKWTKLDRYLPGDSNEFSMFITSNDNNICSRLESKVRISDKGIIKIKSEGFSSKNSTGPNYKNTVLNILIKGYYVSYDKITKAEKTADLDSLKIDLLLNKVDLQLELNNYDEVIKYSQKVIEINPYNYTPYIYLGLAYYKKAHYDLSIKYFKMAIKSDYNNAKVYYDIGKIMFDQNMYKLALKYLIKAYNIEKFYLKAIEKYGYYLYNENNYEDSIKYLEKIIEFDPTNENVYIYIGYSYLEIKNIDKCIEYYKKAVNINHDNAEYKYNIGVLYYQEKLNYDQSIIWLKEALITDPLLIEAYEVIALAYRMKEDWDQVIKYYNFSIELDIKGLESKYFHIGFAYKMKEDWDMAIKYLYKSIEVDPKYILSLESIGLVYYEKGNYEVAIKYLEIAIVIDPSFAPAYVGMGLVNKKLKKIDKAIFWFKKAIEFDSSNTEALKSLGSVYQEEAERYINLAKDIELNKKVELFNMI